MKSVGGAPFGARVVPSTFLIGILNAGSPDIWKWYNEQSAAKQCGFRQLIDIAFFKYMLQWQRRVSEGNQDVMDTMISNLADQSNAFSAAYNSNPHTKGVLRRVIRQTFIPVTMIKQQRRTEMKESHQNILFGGDQTTTPNSS